MENGVPKAHSERANEIYFIRIREELTRLPSIPFFRGKFVARTASIQSRLKMDN